MKEILHYIYHTEDLTSALDGWLKGFAGSLGLPLWVASAIEVAAVILMVCVFLALVALFLVYLERKVAGHFQLRHGPMRVGPHGIVQTIADAMKLFFKEDIVPDKADKAVHYAAPAFSFAAVFVGLGFIPWSDGVAPIDINVGILFYTAISSLGVLGLLMAGWGSNNKWSLLGGMRAGAQIISYELSASLAILVVVMFSGTLSISGIVESQREGWWIWRGHLPMMIAFIIYIIAGTAETNRTPFDLPEAEAELTAGYHTEYSGIRFAMFFLAEFLAMFLVCAIGATLFLGGWLPFQIGGLEGFNSVMGWIPPFIWFFAKTFFLIFVLMWFRWTFPRLRIDQLMQLEWKFLMPLGLLNLVLASLIVISGLYAFSA